MDRREDMSETAKIELAAILYNIKEIRKSRKMSQKELSEISGLTQKEVSGIETGDKIPTIKKFIMYLNALDISLLSLLKDEIGGR